VLIETLCFYVNTSSKLISVPSSFEMKEHLNVEDGFELHFELSVDISFVFNSEKLGFKLHTNQLVDIPIIPYTMYITK
jgi:hypothetical protein